MGKGNVLVWVWDNIFVPLGIGLLVVRALGML